METFPGVISYGSRYLAEIRELPGFAPTGKVLGCYHPHPHNRKEAEQTENQPLTLDPQGMVIMGKLRS